MYNGCSFQRQCSAVSQSLEGVQYRCSEVNEVMFPENYRKSDDLDKRLPRKDKIWDLDRERSIFTIKRGYRWAKEDKKVKLEREVKKDSGKDGNEGDKISLKEDGIIVKKDDWNKMKEELKEFRKEVKEVDALKKEVERLSAEIGEDETGNVAVPEKSMETLRKGVEIFKRNFEMVWKGKNQRIVMTINVQLQRSSGLMTLINHQDLP